MQEADRIEVQNKVNQIVNRIQSSPFGRDGELVKIILDLQLQGQPAINYEVSKIFAGDKISDQKWVEVIFRLGLSYTMETVRQTADAEGIRI